MMKMRLMFAASTAVVAAWLASPAQAGCVISPDKKSIDVVTDNPASDAKNCSVKCQVDTKIGVVAIGCGGNTPPLAKAHSLCDFDKPESWYKKVISSEDSCKTSAESAPAKTAPQAAAPANSFQCRISADGKTVDAMIANPYKSETSCEVDCQISTTNPGASFGISCNDNVAPGVGAVVVCSRTYDKGRLVKMVSGKGECVDPGATAKPDDAEKDDDDSTTPDSDQVKIPDEIRKQLPPDAQKALDELNKP